MSKLAIVGVFLFSIGVDPLTAQEKVIIGGSGAMGDAVEVLAKAYKQKHPSDLVDVISEPMSTTGGIAGVKIRRLRLALSLAP